MDRIFQGLNEQQAAAVAAVRGPVCILAGAGSGKTTTITRRIANQIATGTFDASEILAVTFTDKAAREMAARLQRLGVPAVRARTFHAQALALYKAFSSDAAEIVPSKGQILSPLVKRLPPPHKFTAVRDIATEIEWAKNRMIGPDRYIEVATAESRVTPVPVEVMGGLYKTYERRKEAAGLMDFEDLLARTIELLRTDERAMNAVRTKYRAFTVDEYQDVNLLQQSLLDVWVGERRDLCVVGDDYQSIFGFTGATPRYLLDFPERHDAQVFRLTVNYRSTPQVLNVANRLVPKMGGSPKSLTARAGADGPEPVFREHATGSGEVEWIVRQCRALRNAGVPWEEMAVLYRINGRSEDLEEAFSADRLPYQVRDGSFLRRPAARSVIAKLKRAPDTAVGPLMDQIARGLGWREEVPDDTDASEATRQADLGRLRALAHEFDDATKPDDAKPVKTRAELFVEDLGKRFAVEREGRGVQILTYHRSKGLEFEAVFLPRMEEKELPFALSKSDAEIAEERRLLYVGITRAKKYLFVSWAAQRPGDRRRSPKRSPFLAEMRPQAVPTSGRLTGTPAGAAAASREAESRPKVAVGDEHLALFTALKDWRLQAARKNGVPAYVVFHDQTLARIAQERPANVIELGRISGIGPTKIQRYGSEVLDLIGTHAG
ncbi:MAG TPA: ATP-dependent DNA helicase UvrD2 [Actinomycetota bacterium]|nr:ATP-dependent DNA helicase UvrD2 [Actinomycetota bacterium]